MRGVLWGWLFLLGAIFWAIMLGLDYFNVPFINQNNSTPEPMVINIEEISEDSSISKYIYQVLALSAILGITCYIHRRYLKKNETKMNDLKQKTVNEELEKENASKSMTDEEQTSKNSLEVSNDDGDHICNNDSGEKESQESHITPPSVDVQELQARLRLFEDNLAMLKQKGERLINHTEIQKKRWEELNAGDQ